MPIPDLEANGELPVGIHIATVQEVEDKFGKSSDRRKFLMAGLKSAIKQFKQVDVKKVFVDGSFTTGKKEPNDIDGCWAASGVSEDKLNLLDENFWKFKTVEEFEKGRAEIKKKYGLDFFIAEQVEGSINKPFLEFFQTNRDGEGKGIIQIDI